ncbi:tetraketide alpha-pyrone reductase 2 isoform X2 [Cucumis sativus]|uniref:tetraketide alpha-pyrone reductase 2 isoform X2 n=1 Tax=Cucumis sativus TaxID=3659 RepID=UPI0012F4D022|nr:tetraketide alpha-pyrone reductase 2 isoform X2 [Cucumis sativus]
MPEYCVTGGTGFIASYLVKTLLENGHHVRTTVRNPDYGRVGFLWEFNGAKERLKIVKADLLEEGSFDEAIEGVDGVFHTASPVLVPYDNNIKTTLIDPSINGTVNVLNSCLKANSVKRVVLTSSCSAIRYRYDVQQLCLLNESHWTDPDYCKRYNVRTNPSFSVLFHVQRKINSIQSIKILRLFFSITFFIWVFWQLWYAFAKTLAEKEAWRMAGEHGIDLVVVNPSFVVGPLLTPKPTSTQHLVLTIMKGERGEYPNCTLGFVHVDDVVAAHILAMENPKASGRIICSSTVAHWSQIIDTLRSKYPSYPFESKCSFQQGECNPHNMDTSKISELGFPGFKTMEQMFDDSIKSFQDKGFL